MLARTAGMDMKEEITLLSTYVYCVLPVDDHRVRTRPFRRHHNSDTGP